ncbi:hypothetical protein [Desulfobulbus sp.]|uniref:hypothetical protein n=1 Tax=Desulfobulbus sp. TaxID=895 RepID=UPI00286F9DC4|nr:hypothetical protein [Desulfobulbus sp.]
MSTREELEERVDDCQVSEEYIQLATDIVNDVDDRQWAAEVLESGAEWAATAEELLGFADCALRVLDSGDLGARFMARAREMCRTPAELSRLAETAAAAGDLQTAREIYWAAAEKCASAVEIFSLARSIGKQPENGALAAEIAAMATDRCVKCSDFTELAKAVLRSGGEPEQARSLLESARQVCASVADFQTLAGAVLEVLDDRPQALNLIGEAAGQLEKSSDLAALADFSAGALQDSATAVRLYRAAAERSSSGDELIKLAETVMAHISDQELSLEIYRQAARKLDGHAGLMKLAQSALAVTGDQALADLWFQQAGDAAVNAEQLIAAATALAEKVSNRDAACVLLRKAEGVAATMAAFAVVAQAILAMTDDPVWRAAIKRQLALREQYKDEYAAFMKREQECQSCACLRHLAGDVHRLSCDVEYCRRLYGKARQRAVFFEELLAVAAGVARHVGDNDWIADIHRQLLSRKDDLAGVNAVVAQMVMLLPDGRDRAHALYQSKKNECVESGCFIRLADSVLELLGDKEWCRELYRAAEQAATTRAELTVLARYIEERLQDRIWVESLYARAGTLCRNGLEFVGLVKAVATSRLCSPDLMRLLHEHAEKSLSQPDDLLLLAESIARHCQDSPWSSRIYREAVLGEGGHDKRFAAAASIMRSLGDRELADTIRSL